MAVAEQSHENALMTSGGVVGRVCVQHVGAVGLLPRASRCSNLGVGTPGRAAMVPNDNDLGGAVAG